MCQTRRRLLVAAMFAIVVTMVCIIGVNLGPSYYSNWREQTLRAAFEHRTGPQRWWPSSWWKSYDQHVEMSNELSEREKERTKFRNVLNAYEKLASDAAGSPAGTRFEAAVEKLRQKLSTLDSEVESLNAELARW
jgi:hypothetical protein